jgi:lipid-A-disaccharide synthase
LAHTVTAPIEIMVVAGEASGDLHASHLVAELKKRRPDVRFFGMGGVKLAREGLEQVYDAKELSVMGITEVLPKLFRILAVMRGLEREAARRRPAVAVLVDIPDFNLRLAKKLKRLGIRVAYYISPMVWAWRPGRVKEIARVVDEMLCILPFEEPFYRAAGVSARYVGSPVLEQVPRPAEASSFRESLKLAARPTLALLPGSRMSEIRRILPAMVDAARRLVSAHPGLQVVVPVAPSIPRGVIEAAFARSGVEPVLVDGRAPEVVGASDVAIVASGTATLEAGLMERPLVVVYRVSMISYLVGRALLKVAHIALVNLLAGRRLVPELIQGEMTPERITAEVERVWQGPERAQVIEGLRSVRRELGEIGASARAADAVIALFERK